MLPGGKHGITQHTGRSIITTRRYTMTGVGPFVGCFPRFNRVPTKKTNSVGGIRDGGTLVRSTMVFTLTHFQIGVKNGRKATTRTNMGNKVAIFVSFGLFRLLYKSMIKRRTLYHTFYHGTNGVPVF